MAHSRLEKIGTIYSRVTGLVKSGAMKLEERPLWYQVYQAFPPEKEPVFDRVEEDTPIRKVFYPEDVIRAKYYRKVSHLPPVNISNRKDLTPVQKCINLCLQIQKERGVSLEEAFNEAFDKLKVDSAERTPNISVKPEVFQEETASVSKLDIKNILKDS